MLDTSIAVYRTRCEDAGRTGLSDSVGEVGITVEELLAMQEINDQVPEWIRMQPGETVRAEGDEESRGITIPGAGVHYLHG
jgi:hypothetical protein